MNIKLLMLLIVSQSALLFSAELPSLSIDNMSIPAAVVQFYKNNSTLNRDYKIIISSKGSAAAYYSPSGSGGHRQAKLLYTPHLNKEFGLLSKPKLKFEKAVFNKEATHIYAPWSDSYSRMLNCWNIETKTAQSLDNTDAISSFDTHPFDNSKLFISDDKKCIRLWDIETHKVRETIRHTDDVYLIQYAQYMQSPAEQMLYKKLSFDQNESTSLVIHDGRTQKPSYTYSVSQEERAVCNNGQNLIASYDENKGLTIYDIRKRIPIMIYLDQNKLKKDTKLFFVDKYLFIHNNQILHVLNTSANPSSAKVDLVKNAYDIQWHPKAKWLILQQDYGSNRYLKYDLSQLISHKIPELIIENGSQPAKQQDRQVVLDQVLSNTEQIVQERDRLLDFIIKRGLFKEYFEPYFASTVDAAIEWSKGNLCITDATARSNCIRALPGIKQELIKDYNNFKFIEELQQNVIQEKIVVLLIKKNLLAECPVCYELYADQIKIGTVVQKIIEPCGCVVCQKCYPALSKCPLCQGAIQK